MTSHTAALLLCGLVALIGWLSTGDPYVRGLAVGLLGGGLAGFFPWMKGRA